MGAIANYCLVAVAGTCLALVGIYKLKQGDFTHGIAAILVAVANVLFLLP